MSPPGEHRTHSGVPPIDESLVIDTVRLEAERQRRELQERDEQNRRRQAKHDRVMLRLTFGLLVATLITSIAAIYQARSSTLSAGAAKRASEVASNTFRLTFRPRLSLLGITPAVQSMVSGKLQTELDSGTLRVSISVPNTGPFPARNVRFFRYDNVSTRDQAKPLRYEELPGEPKFIPPKAEGNWNSSMLIPGSRTITAVELKGLESGTLWATFSVLITYEDDLGREVHHAEYCDLFTLQPANDVCPWPVRND